MGGSSPMAREEWREGRARAPPMGELSKSLVVGFKVKDKLDVDVRIDDDTIHTLHSRSSICILTRATIL